MLAVGGTNRSVDEDNEIETNIRRWVVAHQIDGFGPNHPPHVHVVTHIDGTANTVAGGPDHLREDGNKGRHSIGTFKASTGSGDPNDFCKCNYKMHCEALTCV